MPHPSVQADETRLRQVVSEKDGILAGIGTGRNHQHHGATMQLLPIMWLSQSSCTYHSSDLLWRCLVLLAPTREMQTVSLTIHLSRVRWMSERHGARLNCSDSDGDDGPRRQVVPERNGSEATVNTASIVDHHGT